MFVDVVSVSDVGPRLDFVPDKVVVDADSMSDVGLRLVPDEVVVTADSMSDVGPRLVPGEVIVCAVSVFNVGPRLVPDKVVVNSFSVDWYSLVSDPFTVEKETVTVSVVGARLDPVSEDAVSVDCVGSMEDTATDVVNNRLDFVEV